MKIVTGDYLFRKRVPTDTWLKHICFYLHIEKKELKREIVHEFLLHEEKKVLRIAQIKRRYYRKISMLEKEKMRE